MMMTKTPNQFNRRILLAVTGLSPQIVTETIYGLTVSNHAEDKFIPTEVHVITTTEGAQRVQKSLLSDGTGWFHKLIKEYDLPAIEFNENNIHIFEDHEGQPLLDVKSQEDNVLAADFITKIVQQFSADPGIAIHVSIAGGRKTIGFFLGYALTLFGREQDRMSHVLVSSSFEAHPEFFYPSKKDRWISVRDEDKDEVLEVNTKDAEVMLSNIPFVSLRHGLTEELLKGTASYSQTVDAAKTSFAPPYLQLNLKSKTVVAGDLTFKLPPGELALLALFARRAKKGEPPIQAPNKYVNDKDWSTIYLAEIDKIAPHSGNSDKTRRALRQGMNGDYFSSKLTKLQKSIIAQLGTYKAGPYLIDGGGTKTRQYQLLLKPEQIEIACD